MENSGHRPDCDTKCQTCAVSYCQHPECVHPRSAPLHLRRDENCAAFVNVPPRTNGGTGYQIRCDCFDMTYPGDLDPNEPPARLATF